MLKVSNIGQYLPYVLTCAGVSQAFRGLGVLQACIEYRTLPAWEHAGVLDSATRESVSSLPVSLQLMVY
jgi:hypothetical protein